VHKLLRVFLLTLAAHGLTPGALDPWRGWLAFKEFARAVHEVPDPGVSVQFTRTTEEGQTRLVFLRQAGDTQDGWLTPVGGVVCEFVFSKARHPVPAWDRWSFDYASFERFVDIVEQEPVFQDLIVTQPLRSAVYWEEA
jgi:hypothetical protein